MLIVSLVLLQVVIFTVLIFVLRSIMSQNVTSATKHLDDLNSEVGKKEEEISRRLQEAEQKSQDLLAQTQTESQSAKEKVLQEAQAEKERILAQAREKSEELIQQADKSRQLLISEIEERVTRQAIAKACEIIQQALPESFKQEVHSRWFDDLMARGFTQQLEKLPVPDDLKDLTIISAFSLTKPQQGVLKERLAAAFKQDIHFKEEVDPMLVAGLIIKINSFILDGSLKNQIKEKVKGV
jgi:F0F1-type ATP synthase delta subunit